MERRPGITSDLSRSTARLSLYSRQALPALWLFCGVGAARADEPVSNGEAVPATGEPSGPVAAPVPASASSNRVVEELPPSAYPEPLIRGIHGGSLWSTFHGLQWPYYTKTGIGLSGYAWLDNSYERTKIGLPTTTTGDTRKEYLQQGRLLLRVTPTYTNEDWFVQAQAELVANKDQTTPPASADTDDVWVRFGRWRQWDVMVGRFEGFEVYHLGMGLDLNTQERGGAFDDSNGPPDLKSATFLLFRPDGAGNAAFHYYVGPNLRLEVLGQYGSTGGLNEIGGRPAAVFDVGWLKIKAAAEYQWLTARGNLDKTEKRNRGVSLSSQVVSAAGIEFGANFIYAVVDVFDPQGIAQAGTSGNILSYGGFANARLIDNLLLGVGANYVTFEDLHLNVVTGANDRSTNLQAFTALQYLVGGQVFIKLVGAYGKSHFEKAFSSTGPYNDSMYSVRLRVMYLF
jgi:hypothetical protein